MQHVDALSRNTNITVVEANSFEDNLIICQAKDKKLKDVRQKLENEEDKMFELRNGVIYRKSNNGKLLFCVPEEIEEKILYKYHNELGHLGRDKVMGAIVRTYWFSNMKEKVVRHIENCIRCVAYSPKTGKGEGLLYSLPKGNVPFEIINIDHYGPVDIGRAKKHLFVVIDGFTKYVRLYATKTTNTKEVIIALKDYFRSYSIPTYIVWIGEAVLRQKILEHLECNIKHVKIATGSPQANGQVERINRIVGPMITKLADPEEKMHWDTVVEDVEFSLNNTKQRSVAQMPSKMLFGIEQKGKVVDELRQKLEELDNVSDVRDLDKIRKVGSEAQRKLQKDNEQRYNEKRTKSSEYKVGDNIMIKILIAQ